MQILDAFGDTCTLQAFQVLEINQFLFKATLRQIIINDTQLLHAGGPYHIEISQMICSAYQWTGFYTIGSSVMEELNINMTT